MLLAFYRRLLKMNEMVIKSNEREIEEGEMRTRVCVSLVRSVLEPDLKWTCSQYRDAKMGTVFGKNDRAEYIVVWILGWGHVVLLKNTELFSRLCLAHVKTKMHTFICIYIWQEDVKNKLAPIVLNQFVLVVSDSVIAQKTDFNYHAFVLAVKLSISKVLLIGRAIGEHNCVKTTMDGS
jgi:hypothetical protein